MHVTTRHLTPHEYKLYSEILCRVRLGVTALEMLHYELEDDFAQLYKLTGNPIFLRASETLHSTPHPLFHQGIPQ
jgi:hypothetical protein